MTIAALATHAQLDLGFARRGERTVMDRRLFAWPFVLTRSFALDAVPAHMLSVIVQTSSGAVHGEDRLKQRIRVAPGAAAHITTQGATSVHRAHPGFTSREAITLEVAPDGQLEYLPEPRILFPDSALDQTVEIEVARSGAAIIADAFTVHDPLGEARSFRRLTSSTILRRAGEAALIDRLDIMALPRRRGSRYAAFGTVLMVMPEGIGRCEELALTLTERLGSLGDLYGAASPLPMRAGVGVRLAAPDLRSVRAGITASWIAYRLALHGVAPADRRFAAT
ncbi:urease accessory protein [Kaistia soli DSM 19436]|uniref:Urease accessory protein UreD n=1 Tax=Kaistia soli DSM 19436 TaxID=1122133 RepID=A0A1M4TZG4_9HYPH|nr:urease accessory protein UreD [Kaistia soli]SHE49839.1 urease accessory protein [Kaistia soli DSM 19436]